MWVQVAMRTTLCRLKTSEALMATISALSPTITRPESAVLDQTRDSGRVLLLEVHLDAEEVRLLFPQVSP